MVKDRIKKATGQDLRDQANKTTQDTLNTLKWKWMDYYQVGGKTRLGKWENGSVKYTPNAVPKLKKI